MVKSSGGCHGPCLLAHDLVNKLSVIIGNCDLLVKHVESGSECANRLDLIRNVARGMAKELNQHQCELSEVIRARVGMRHPGDIQIT
ncbi:MAG: hypothetical protein WAN17_20105 [Candidatus Sulfotelmatobacter sp.]